MDTKYYNDDQENKMKCKGKNQPDNKNTGKKVTVGCI